MGDLPGKQFAWSPRHINRPGWKRGPNHPEGTGRHPDGPWADGAIRGGVEARGRPTRGPSAGPAPWPTSGYLDGIAQHQTRDMRETSTPTLRFALPTLRNWKQARTATANRRLQAGRPPEHFCLQTTCFGHPSFLLGGAAKQSLAEPPAREDCRSEAMPGPLQIALCWNPSARHERATMARAILPRDRINAPRSSPTIRADTSGAPTLRRLPRGRLHESSEADSAECYASARSRVDFHISDGVQGRNAGSKRSKLTAPPGRLPVLFFKKNLDAVATEKHSGLGTLESALRAKPKSAQTEPAQNETQGGGMEGKRGRKGLYTTMRQKWEGSKKKYHPDICGLAAGRGSAPPTSRLTLLNNLCCGFLAKTPFLLLDTNKKTLLSS